ncbi:MAG TPA: cell division protein FtsK [Oceanospirillaceae bacterium]|nr:cell division protein FtsK [Oceanospirillaceae bacterium]
MSFSLETLYQKYSWYGFRLLWLTIGVYLAIVLVSYDPLDPSFVVASDAPTVNNLGGYIGSGLASLLFLLFGVVAFVIPLVFMARNLSQLLGAKSLVKRYTLYKLLAFILALLAASTLVAIHLDNSLLAYPRGSGGVVGANFAQPIVKALGLIGANLLLLIVCFLAMSHLLALNWGAITEVTGRWVERHVNSIWQALFSDKPESAAHKMAKAKQESSPQPTEAKGPGVFSRYSTAIYKGLRDLFSRKPKNAAVMQNVQVGRTAELFAQADNTPISDDEVLSALDDKPKRPKPTAKAQAPVEAAATVTTIEPVKASQTTPSATKQQAAEAGKRDVKIVPLEKTHKQDTGDSSATQDGKATKSKQCPPVSLLDPPETSLNPGVSTQELEQMSELLEAKLMDFGVVAEVVEVNPGPVITRFEIQPAPGTKVSKISNLAKDLARSMAVMSVRVVEVIAGKSVIGIEIPNQHREMVRISEVIGSKTYQTSSSPLTMGLGNDIAGKPVVVDLGKMPHLLVAGTTGAGKSVGVNAMIISLLLKSTPDQVRLLLVDPKMLELSIYDGIPHLLAPVITDMKEAAGGLRWCVAEMERRYKVMASQGVRNIAGYNTKVNDAIANGEHILDPTWQPDELAGETAEDRPYLEDLPYIVVVVDEFADMMMIVGKKVEELIARIAQKARAAGIHLILATQRPSVDVITGLIKANVPTRIAFQVSSKIDSRTILDQGGAESLLGHGDMLYLPAGKSVPERVHGAFVSDDEVHRVVEDWKQRGSPNFIDAIIEGTYDQEGGTAQAGGGDYEEEMDQLYDAAVAFVTETRRASISSVQRKFKIGYNRAARMIEAMEAAGVITSQAHNGSREVIAPPPVRD